MEKATTILQNNRAVIIEGLLNQKEVITVILNQLIVHPIEVGYLKLYVSVSNIEVSEDLIKVRVEIPELYQ